MMPIRSSTSKLSSRSNIRPRMYRAESTSSIEKNVVMNVATVSFSAVISDVAAASSAICAGLGG